MSLDRIREIPIADIIGKHVALKQKGRNHTGLCPFHNEKTPSFVVSDHKGVFKCFGCGEGGDGISFYMKKFGLSFIEACQRLAIEHNIEFEARKISHEEIAAGAVRHETLLFLKAVAAFYQETLETNPDAAKYVKTRISESNIELFQIGFAPPGWTVLYDAMRQRGYKEEFLLQSGLFTQKDNGKIFDFFQNRIIFPIKTFTGDVVGFSGRVMDNSQPKYLNSPESPLFEKGRILYGLFEAAQHIKNSGCVYLTEGYTDVTSMHEGNMGNTVGMMGTALTPDHLKLLRRYTNNVTLCTDADQAGQKSMMKSAELLVSSGFRVSVVTNIPLAQDPDSFFRTGTNEPNVENFLIHLAQKFFGPDDYDPLVVADNMREIARWLNMLSPVERKSMVEYLATTYRKKGVTKKSLDSALDIDKADNRDEDRQAELDESMLPDYVDREEYRKYGFYASQGLKGDTYAKNQYIFENGGRVSNFTMEPLFHVDSEIDVKKIFKAVNKHGKRKTIELDLDALNSVQTFRKTVEKAGNFLFEGTDRHLMHLKRMWYDKTDYCMRIEKLGWQQQGFWAWANGITTMDDNFIPCDDNGIIEFDGRKFFIAPYSSIYRNRQQLFTSERKFIYIKNETGLNEWMRLFIEVFGSQAMISFAYYLTSLYSDFIFERLNALPMLNIYGQKGTGKNEQAASLTTLFGLMQDPCQIHNTTKAGLSAHLEEFTNALAWIDEYKNAIPLEYIEILKAIYNRMGRNKKSLQAGFGKETTTVTSMGIITGQEMLTADIALFSRVICLMYYKVEFTKEEDSALEKLKNMRGKGLSHITARLVRQRHLVTDNFSHQYNQVRKEMEKYVSSNQGDGRLLKNYLTILTTFKCLEPVMELPFTYTDLLNECVRCLMRQNELMYNSNELANFWSIIEHGVERRILQDGTNYKIKMTDYIKVIDKAAAKEIEFKPDKEVLLLKWAGIYQFYSETARRTTTHALPESTLLHYITTSSYFIGKVKSVRFGSETNQAYAFDYGEIRLNFKRPTVDGDPLAGDDTDRITDPVHLNGNGNFTQLSLLSNNNDEAPW